MLWKRPKILDGRDVKPNALLFYLACRFEEDVNNPTL